MADVKVSTTQLAKEFQEFVEEEARNHQSVQEKLDALVEGQRKREVAEAAREHLYGQIAMHHRTLYGDPEKGTPGHSQRLMDLEKLSGNITRLTWIVVTELVVAVGAGIIWLLSAPAGG